MKGAFHSTKITGSNFRNFRWSNASQNSKSRALQPQGMLGETLLCLKMADFLNLFVALEQGDCETSCTILDSNDNLILLAAVACFMQRELTRVNGYFEVTITAYLLGEFENHFRMTREMCQLLTQEIKHTGRNPTGSSSGRPTILPEKQILLFLWSVANRETYRTIANAW